MDAEVVSFQLSNGTGTQVVGLNGSFTPNLILFFNQASPTADAFATDPRFHFGAAAGTGGAQTGCCGVAISNNTDTSAAGRRIASDRIFTGMTNTGGIGNEDFNVDSFGAGQFTINKLASDSANRWVTAIALNVDNAWVGVIDIDPNEGTFDITDPGFQPNALILATTDQQNVDTGELNASLSIGCAVSSSNRFALSIRDEQGQDNSNSVRYHDDAFVLCAIDPTNDVIGWATDFDSFLATGFRLDNGTTEAGEIRKALAVAIAVDNVNIGNYSHPTSTGDDSVSGAGFTPKLAMEFSAQLASLADLIEDDLSISIGAATGSGEQGAIWAGAEDGQDITDNDRYFASDAISFYGDFDQNIVGEAAFSSFDADGHTNNWGTAPASAIAGSVLWLGDTIQAEGGWLNGGIAFVQPYFTTGGLLGSGIGFVEPVIMQSGMFIGGAVLPEPILPHGGMLLGGVLFELPTVETEGGILLGKPAFDNGFLFRSKITIPQRAAALGKFPLRVHLDVASDGAELRFEDESGNELPHQVVHYSPTINAVVDVSVSDASDTIIYAYWK